MQYCSFNFINISAGMYCYDVHVACWLKINKNSKLQLILNIKLVQDVYLHCWQVYVRTIVTLQFYVV